MSKIQKEIAEVIDAVRDGVTYNNLLLSAVIRVQNQMFRELDLAHEPSKQLAKLEEAAERLEGKTDEALKRMDLLTDAFFNKYGD